MLLLPLLCLIPGLLIRIPVGGAGILLADIVLPVCMGWFVLGQVIQYRKVPTTSFLLPGILFGLVGIFSWCLQAWDLDLKENLISFFYIIRWISLLFFATAAKAFYGDNINKLLRLLFILTAIILALGYLQFYLIPDLSNYSTVGGFDPHIGRFLGTWMDPNFVAGLLAFMIPMMMGMYYSRIKPDSKGVRSQESGVRGSKILNKKRFSHCRLLTSGSWLLALILLALFATFLTFSRSGYLAVGTGVGLFLLLRDPKMLLVGIIAMTLGVLSSPRAQQRLGELTGTIANVVLQETDEVDPTASLRLQNWGRTLTLWQQYPIVGIGYNTYRFIAEREGIVEEGYFSSGGSDASLLTVLVTTGIVGFLVFLYWYLKLWTTHVRLWWQRATPHPDLHLAFSCGFLALLLHSFFVNSLLFPLILMPVMAVAGGLDTDSA